jgi:DNA-binding GntR family transcriptional regulator
VRTLSGAQKFRSKSEIVYDFLKLNILNGNLKSGERIAVSDVAKILGISGIPIREALTKLEAEGLVTITPHIGASVISIDKTEFEEIHVIRTELEGLATRLACRCLKEEDFERLEQILTESEAAFAAADYNELTELNESFHFTIYRSCPNQPLNKMIVELLNKSRFASSSLVISESRAKNSIEEHRLIVQALKANDGERASQIVKQQKKESWATISKSIQEHCP